MLSQVPAQIQNQKYISLTTFRQNGVAVSTPVWFGEQDGRLYVMTRGDMGKAKRIRNNPQVRVAPCSIRGGSHGAGVCGDSADFAARGARAGAGDHQPEVLAGEGSVDLGANGYLF